MHLNTWRNGMPDYHLSQLQGQMWVLDLKWLDFCSYDPRMQSGAPHLKLYCQRIARDEAYNAHLKSAVLKFLDDVEKEVGPYRKMGRKGESVRNE